MSPTSSVLARGESASGAGGAGAGGVVRVVCGSISGAGLLDASGGAPAGGGGEVEACVLFDLRACVQVVVVDL
jgi:hypothetical protein